MIQAIMLIALGFLTAALIGVLLAPSLWSRASRLSKKKLESTLPLTLAEIEATQDQLRASYAVRIRRLESSLASAKQKAANQLVDNSRLQMQIGSLRDQIADFELQLSERRNAATVLEQTITKRFPELDREITAVKAQLQERSYELQDLNARLARRDEEIEAVQAAAASYQEELQRLHQVLEKSAADRSGRRVRRASQWDLEDYRAEYDRLNLELSKLRQQLVLYQDRDAQQVSVIKGEVQKLAELILASAQPRSDALPSQRIEPPLRRLTGPDVRKERPIPWRERASAEIPVAARPPQERIREPAPRPALPQPAAAEEPPPPAESGSSLTLSPVLSVLPEEKVLGSAAQSGHGEATSRSLILQEVVTDNRAQQPAESGQADKGGRLNETSLSRNGAGSGSKLDASATEKAHSPSNSNEEPAASSKQPDTERKAKEEEGARPGTLDTGTALPQDDAAIPAANGVRHADQNGPLADANLEDVINLDTLKPDPEPDKIGPHQPRLLERLRGVSG